MEDTPGLQEEIAELKARLKDTRELYREVCVLLFFRHGITPTANRLYQLVRRGSMGTPAEVLRQFWQSLRERSRVRLDHPELPAEFRELGGEVLSTLWTRALALAQAELSPLTDEARQARDEAAQLQAATRTELAALRERVSMLEAQLQMALAREMESARELATNQGRFASMTEMLRDSGQEMLVLRQELARAQRDVARAVGEANALRVQLGLLATRGRRPVPGLPGAADPGQEPLELEDTPSVSSPADPTAPDEPRRHD
ncbi:MAG: DNA-binding protein [Betaproteobacteria bacterium]|nr:DNA-binding protein [Betaproteobacteria bacterium]